MRKLVLAHSILPPNRECSVKINVLGFVDDCSGQTTLDPCTGETLHDLLQKMEKDIQFWRDLLYVSGGELSHSKCTYHVTCYTFMKSGSPILSHTPERPPLTITLEDKPHVIKKLSPVTPHKMFRCYASPSGNKGKDILKLKSNALGLMLHSSSYSHHESWVFYIMI